eukprot:TRINITY_DN29465_c0_g1_i1.p1 TRINITY_DN29465_c0_g1~~TRINITY_DN29465_c0_g1_i1.p1  ORF type:complete len:319 (-),score=81.41 TRINITY_DN29465_c0_g1_i1:17-973(-)
MVFASLRHFKCTILLQRRTLLALPLGTSSQRTTQQVSWQAKAAVSAAVAALTAAGASRSNSFCSSTKGVEADGQLNRLRDALEPLRAGEEAMRARWVKEEEGWFQLPPRAWPEVQPKAHEVSLLREQLQAERCPPPGASSMSPKCTQLTFDLASALVFSAVDASAGLATYRGLASTGHLDSMVATAVVLVEGLGVERNYEEALRLLRSAADKESAQAYFELGSLLYTGGADLEENELAAYEFFRKAADQGHRDGMFMVADCLLEGTGCERDLAAAVPLLHSAAMKGHRGARQHLRQLLDGKWMGFDGAAGEARILIQS